MVMNIRKTIFRTVVFIGFLFFLYAIYYGWQVAAIGMAYKAKVLCSSVYISNRNPQDVMREELGGIINIIDTDIDFDTKSVTTSLFGFPNQRAVYRKQLGCTLLAGASEKEVLSDSREVTASPLPDFVKPQPYAGFAKPGKEPPPEVSVSRLSKAVDAAFAEKDFNNPIRSRAVVIVYDGQIIAERYAPGISAETALPGWSMSKSVTSALVGILVKQGKLSIYNPVQIAAWSGADDPRKNITLDQLLRMSSGLAFDERSGPVVSDVNQMLLRSQDSSSYAINKPLRYEPGSRWHYSSGTTNIISRVIRDSLGESIADYHNFPREFLFNKIGMTSAIMEVDASGTFVGSSFMYATARDWARFGLLYLRDGVWEGERILPSGWVRYSVTPSPTAPDGQYGAHFWTNGFPGTNVRARPLMGLPADTYYASGYEGQYIVIIPSHKLVVVRLGQTKSRKAWNMESFVSDILAAISTNAQ